MGAEGTDQILHGSALDLNALNLPVADLVFTSPPYRSFRNWDEPGFASYWSDFDLVFSQLRGVLNSSGLLVVEVSNVSEPNGQVQLVAFEAAQRLRHWYAFLGEIVRCNTSEEEAGPGFNHSYLLVCRPKADDF